MKLRPDEPARVLASGFDTLYLAIDVTWPDESMFAILDDLKAKAQREEKPALLDLPDGCGDWAALAVQAHGSKGYEWLIGGHEMAMKIGRWVVPKARPSVMVEIRSETLWLLGPSRAVERVLGMLARLGAKVETVKVSRADLCVDILLPKAIWAAALLDNCVARALYRGCHYSGRAVQGFSIGKGAICARLYDKPLEITQQSHKDWMYVIWNLSVVPEGCRIIRIEFQLRREALKDLKIDTVSQLINRGDEVWSYCTRAWMKFQQSADKHHTQQETMPFWSIVQDGFLGVQGATPAVREKAMQADRKQLVQQMIGLLSSVAALDKQGYALNEPRKASVMEALRRVRDQALELGLNDTEFGERIDAKCTRYRRPRGGTVVEQKDEKCALDENRLS